MDRELNQGVIGHLWRGKLDQHIVLYVLRQLGSLNSLFLHVCI